MTSGRPLDNITSIASPPRDRGLSYSEDGEVTGRFDPTLKWQLQAVARDALPNHRLKICMRYVRPDRREVQVRSNEDRRAYFANLMACGSVWACPVCAAKIQQARAAELRQAIDNWTAQGGCVYMATYTVPHTRSDVLEELLRRFNDAQRRMTSGKGWKRLTAAHGISGQVKGLEVTWGQASGWHPHAHVIYFLSGEATLDLQAALFKRWCSVTVRAGLGEPSIRAFKLQDASKVRIYLNKMGQEYLWNAEHEVVKSMTKRGRGGRYSPFDLLRAYLDAPDDGQMLALFAEYAYTFHGRNQLTWSRGFKKKLLNTEGLTDQQVADSLGQSDPVLAYISLDDWRHIRCRNLQGQVLQIVNEFGEAGLTHLLNAIREFQKSENTSLSTTVSTTAGLEKRVSAPDTHLHSLRSLDFP